MNKLWQWKFSLLVLVALLANTACDSEYIVPVFFYEAPFDPLLVDEVEEIMYDISGKWELSVFEKDREAMKIMTQGQEAFFIALFLEDDSILAIMNAGIGNILTLSLQTDDNFPVEELGKLANEVRRELKTHLNIDLVATEP